MQPPRAPKGRARSGVLRWPGAGRLGELAPEVALLENLRFDPGRNGERSGVRCRADRGQDCYVNDAFGASHREHARSWAARSICRRPPAGCWLVRVEVLGGLRDSPSARSSPVWAGRR